MPAKDHIRAYFQEATGLTAELFKDTSIHDNITEAARLMHYALSEGDKILTCGNGGSMCDAMHFASELTGKYRDVRDPIAAIALSDVAAMTCITNDFGYDKVFLRQLQAIGKRGDVLLAISTSGKSNNVIQAILGAKEKGMKVISLTGQDGMNDASYSDVDIRVPSLVTNHVQEQHIKIIHILVELIEKSL